MDAMTALKNFSTYDGINIPMSSTREDTEIFRLVRLNRVLGYLVAYPGIPECIFGLHDHKGYLIVCVNEAPNAAVQNIIYKAWSSVIGDPAGEVVFNLRGTNLQWRNGSWSQPDDE